MQGNPYDLNIINQNINQSSNLVKTLKPQHQLFPPQTHQYANIPPGYMTGSQFQNQIQCKNKFLKIKLSLK